MDDKMAWARFTADHDHPVSHGQTIEYKAGMRCSVPRHCLDHAKSLGRAQEIQPPSAEMAERLKKNPYASDPPAPPAGTSDQGADKGAPAKPAT